ncbi:putative methionyl aminopeptidase [Helianthus anomalus]
MEDVAAFIEATGSRFSNLELIGRGSFGDVYKGEFQKSSLLVINALNIGVWRDRMWPDGWTAVTADGKRSAQFEHTLLVWMFGFRWFNLSCLMF